MKIHESEVVNDNDRSYRNYPRSIASVLINFYSVYKSWQRLLSVHDGARSK